MRNIGRGPPAVNCAHLPNCSPIWEFPKIRGTLFWGPYNKDLLSRLLYSGPLFSETPIFVNGIEHSAAGPA